MLDIVTTRMEDEVQIDRKVGAEPSTATPATLILGDGIGPEVAGATGARTPSENS